MEVSKDDKMLGRYQLWERLNPVRACFLTHEPDFLIYVYEIQIFIFYTDIYV